MSYNTLKTKQEGLVFTVQFNRPETSNAINMEMVNELLEVTKIVYDSTDISVLVFKGLSDAFCTGIDLCDFTPEKQPDIYGFQKWEKICALLNRIDKLTISAIQGECLGGGFDILLASDIRIAEQKAHFQLEEVKLGFLPGMTTFWLAKFIGLGRAKKLILSGKPLSAERAFEYGLIDEICDIQEIDQTIAKWIKDSEPFRPVSLQLARRLLNESFSESYDNFIGHYLAAQDKALHSEDFNHLIGNARDEFGKCQLRNIRNRE